MTDHESEFTALDLNELTNNFLEDLRQNHMGAFLVSAVIVRSAPGEDCKVVQRTTVPNLEPESLRRLWAEMRRHVEAKLDEMEMKAGWEGAP